MGVLSQLLRNQFYAVQRQGGDPAKIELARRTLLVLFRCTSEDEILTRIWGEDSMLAVDLAEERRTVIEGSFHKRGHMISCPKPAVSNAALMWWRWEGRELFYRPPSAELTYKAFMASHGQAGHSTLEHRNHAKIGWETASVGYWFLIDVARVCLWLRMSWNNLTASIMLPCLEEYMIAYFTHRVLTGNRIDTAQSCFLRTRCCHGVLRIDNIGEEVWVYCVDNGLLSLQPTNTGGRAVEVVKNAA